MAQIELPFGHGTLCVDIPDAVLGEVISPRPVEAAVDPGAVIETALAQPIGSPRLEQIVQPGQKVAVIIDDNTRKTPTHLMLPHVLERLTTVGIRREDIRIVMALGTHRPMSEAEIIAKVGPAIAREYEAASSHVRSGVNASCWDESQLGSGNGVVYLGTSSNGIPAWVNRVVAEADVRVGIGGIIPHADVGYGGGGKIILPGVCSGQTVDAFHARQGKIEVNLLGKVETPIRHDLEQLVGERVGLDFILNAILTLDGELYLCVAGHFIQAHRAGVEIARQVYGVPVVRRYPLVICNSFPADLDLWQSVKGLWTGELMVDDGGILVLVTPCEEGASLHPLFADYIGRDLDALLDELDAGQAEDPNACGTASQICRMKQRIRFGLVSPGLSRADADRMGFAYYDSVEEAIETELADLTGNALVGLITHGGFTVPLVQQRK